MGFLKWFATVALAPAVLAGGLAGAGTAPAVAIEAIDESGTIYPAQASYTFKGTAGQTVTIILESVDFDPVLSLLGPDDTEVAFNDDFGGTLNSQIIFTLPTDGTYTVVAKSFSGQGGDFDVVVRDANAFEMAYAKAEALVLAEDYPGAIAAFTEAIAIDGQQPSAYLGRAQATLGQVYLDKGDSIQGPEDIPAEARDSVIADFEQAATLLEASGSGDWAASLREQIELLRGDAPAN
jgi:hypothetical protein